jgi:hypothetical protein
MFLPALPPSLKRGAAGSSAPALKNAQELSE